MNNFIKSSRDP